jgi:hypothetical protein
MQSRHAQRLFQFIQNLSGYFKKFTILPDMNENRAYHIYYKIKHYYGIQNWPQPGDFGMPAVKHKTIKYSILHD